VKQRFHKAISRRIRAFVRRRCLGNRGIAYLAETDQGVFAVDPSDFGVSRSLLRDGQYDQRAIEWLSGLVSRESTVVFVGCQIGALLVPLSRHAGSVVGYEPDALNFKLLSYNVALNGVANATIKNVAIGDSRGVVRMRHNPTNSGNSSVDPGPAVAGKRGTTDATEVAMVTLDSDLGGRQIDLLVMDVEGFEVHAMRGAANVLANTRYFYVEYCPEQLREQGSTRHDFIDCLSGHFRHAYQYDGAVEAWTDGSWIDWLRHEQPARHLLRNLLFTNVELASGARRRAA
jgi:FkbM family methyltransferase